MLQIIYGSVILLYTLRLAKQNPTNLESYKCNNIASWLLVNLSEEYYDVELKTWKVASVTHNLLF